MVRTRTVGIRGDRADLLQGLLLSHRISIGLTRVAADALGGGHAGNRDVQLMLTVAEEPGLTPSQLSSATGMGATAVSRALRHLSDDGLIARRRVATDGRSSTVRLTRQGWARIAAFERMLVDYFVADAPLVKEVLTLLDVSDDSTSSSPATVLDAAGELSRVGVAFSEELSPLLHPFGLTGPAERFTLALLMDRGHVRPSQLVHDLHLSASGVSDVVNRLVALGTVRRGHDDPTDRRAVIVSLTDLGQRAVDIELDVFARYAAQSIAALARTMPHPEGV